MMTNVLQRSTNTPRTMRKGSREDRNRRRGRSFDVPNSAANRIRNAFTAKLAKSARYFVTRRSVDGKGAGDAGPLEFH